MRYRLRTLLIAAAVGPPMLASVWIGTRFILTNETGFGIFVFVSALTCYGLFSLGLGYTLAFSINALMALIARLQGRR